MKTNFLEINNATFIASEKNKVNNVSLIIKEKGEIVCLLGPSGVGKTTILRTIAGLQDLKSGEIKLKGNIISSDKYNLEPEKRNIALCFQDNSLFPHFNVIDNVNIGAKRKNGSKFNYSDKDLIKILHLEDIQEKYPHQISSGEAQRVSLARSLMSKPDLLLLDEPFSNIDQSLKDELQKRIKDILKELNITTIAVTHDSYEAFYLADKCGIILDQSLKQQGVDPSTQAETYYAKIDEEMRSKYPNFFGVTPPVEIQEETPKRQPQTVVAPTTRDSGAKKPSQVRLTQTQVKIARQLGISPEQYANQLLKEQA